MTRFPDEDLAKAELERSLPRHFDFAKRLLHYWINADKDRGFAQSRLPMSVLGVLLSMSVKACRQFRSVIELCERGEASDGATIARALFETALVVGFVLKPRFMPREFDRRGKATNTISVPGVRLTREFRARLFLAHHVLDFERRAARCSTQSLAG